MRAVIDAGTFGRQLAALAWVAARAFAGTVLAFAAAGVGLAAVAYYALSGEPWVVPAVGAAVALVESVATGVVLGGKRAVVLAAVHGLGRLGLGRAAVWLVFDRVLGLAAGGDHGDRGGAVARGLERVPLARAEELLARAVRAAAGDDTRGGWVRRAVRRRVLEAVRRYTLARFRADEAAHGGVDLVRVRDELEGAADEALAKRLRAGVRVWTVLAAVGLPGAVAVQVWIALLLLRAKG
ncbi:MAG: hypothetical protein ACKODX_19955 [Gemmata sp.]